MGNLIAYFMSNPYEHTEQQAYLFATGLAMLQILLVLAFHPMQLFFFETSLKLRVASCSLIYKKVKTFHRSFLYEKKFKENLVDSQPNKVHNDRWTCRSGNKPDVKRR